VALLLAAVHYAFVNLLAWGLVNDDIRGTHGQNGFFFNFVVPIILWALALRAKLVIFSDAGQQLDIGAENFIWSLNSFVWGLVLGAIVLRRTSGKIPS
jgi:hypothetical protein